MADDRRSGEGSKSPGQVAPTERTKANPWDRHAAGTPPAVGRQGDAVPAPSSERDDTDTKLVDYFSLASVRHYLIVFSDRRVAVHHRRNDDGEIATRIAHDGDIALSPPGLTIPVASLLGPLFAGGSAEV